MKDAPQHNTKINFLVLFSPGIVSGLFLSPVAFSKRFPTLREVASCSAVGYVSLTPPRHLELLTTSLSTPSPPSSPISFHQPTLPLQQSTSSTLLRTMVANVSLVLLLLATGIPGLCQAAANAPSRSLRGHDKGDVDVPRLDLRQQFDNEDFVFDLQGAEPEIEGDAGTVKVANLGNVPALSGEGVSYALVEIEPCGLNLPHHHPRAAEFGYIVKSESSTSVRHAFIEENTGRLIMNDIGEGQVALVPAGLVHFVQNMGCEPATFLAAFSSSDPGVVTTTTQGIALLPEGTIQATLALGSDEAKEIIAGLPMGVVEGEQQCLKRCGLDY